MDKVKAEYIAGGVSIRELAEEHGISESTLEKRAAKEGWTKLRQKTGEKTAEKMADAVSDAKIKKLEQLVDRLITESKTAARQLKRRPVVTTERYEDEDGHEIVKVTKSWERTDIVDKQGLRQLAQTAKDLYAVVSAMQAEGKDKTQSVTVRFEGGEDLAD